MIKNKRLPLTYTFWHEYAELFKEITGRFPRHAPTSGEYPDMRMWAEYSPNIDL